MKNQHGNVAHGHSARGKTTPTYFCWQDMRKRCSSPSMKSYKYYGGRGIHVCKRWESFKNFLADMGEKPAGTSLDRIDNDGNYEPSNCRWSTASMQQRNKRNNRFLTLNGERLCVTDWARRIGLSEAGITKRLKRGLSVAEALRGK